jgi:hypothetical protein
MSDEAFDWDEYYRWEAQNICCNLCAPWMKRSSGSDERILGIKDEDEFLRYLRIYRPNPKDQKALWKERRRRRRDRFRRRLEAS